MAYSAGMLDKRVTVLNRAASVDSDYGRTGGDYATGNTYNANVTWSHGVKAMREGALDAYDTLMVRMRWHTDVTRESRLQISGKVYQIESLNGDQGADEMQITCVELQ